jgi:hypothetical protein
MQTTTKPNCQEECSQRACTKYSNGLLDKSKKEERKEGRKKERMNK